ncbi:MAG: hypothetical protein KIH09_16845 [Candidatus Freyarchaeota archaeon]|nr:hypothetical protein [Candidatus Jordarchaeia archaeon]
MWTTVKGKRALKINVNDKIELVSVEGETLGFWTKEVLKEAFEKKFPGLVYVKADCRGKGVNEEVWLLP